MRNRMQRPLQGRSRLTALVTATLLVAPVVSIADQIVVYPSQDNTLYEDADGSLSNGAGDHLFAGRTDTGLRRRAVLWFDLSVIPEGSVIEDAALWMNLSRSKANDEIVSLHRADQRWGEGSSHADGEEGGGAPSAPGDATWIHTFHPDRFWINAGGDYDTTPSASTVVARQNGFYSWTSFDIIMDVQMWADDALTNHGWVVIGNESEDKTAKRFDSRDIADSGRRPYLVIDFTPPPGAGACCYGDGTCVITTESDCMSSGGVFGGGGTSCDPNPCPQPDGACCLPDGSCVETSEGECALQNGLFQGSGTDCLSNPCPLVPFVDALPIPPIAQPVIGNPGGEATYDIAVVQTTQQLHRDLPPTTVWAYEGTYPGPTILASKDLPVTVRWINDLRDENGQLRTDHFLDVDLCPHGAGDEPRIVTHLHGGHVPADVDGYPEDWFLPGEMVEYVYPNHQDAGTLWYHDHSLGITRLNVIMGMAGFYLLRDDVENALNLPRGPYEIGLAVQDRTFNRTTGQFVYPSTWKDHFFGDTLLVNGMVWPYLNVDRGKYRFRALNGSTSRVYTLALSTGDPFTVIGTEGGLLEAPVTVTQLTMLTGERYDIVVDFEPYAPGTEIILTNSAPAPYPGQPGVGVVPEIMKFVVGPDTGHTDPLPGTLREIERLERADAAEVRLFELRRFNDACAGSIWLINGLLWDDITENPDLGTVEVWEFANRSAISHPMHIHLVLFQVVDRQFFEVQGDDIVPIGDPIPPRPDEDGWKDTVDCPPDMITRVIARFDDYVGTYPYHCHILEHEDHEMMRQFKIYCPADFNKDDSENTLDVLAFLNAWTSDDPRADFNRDGSINTLDVLAFLNAWTAGC
ncbi:MAG: multicopper oxidase domain-containing protein [Planctomycetota bacterium]|nr:MAG: multicopper oxidase domain-containing protein [Planctomycetota bacterium]